VATFEALHGQDVYGDVVHSVIVQGVPREPRGRKTRDLGFTVIELETPYYAFPLGLRPGLTMRIAVAEAVQLIGGFTNTDLLTKAAVKFNDFLEPDGHFHGSYGSRVRYQVASVVRKLKEDSETRQAIVTLWDPVLDNLEDKKDYPCTVMLHFEINRRDLLCMTVVMRSNDVWLGLPYDLFQFTQLQCTVARALGLEPGRYRHVTMSMHIYVEDVSKALDCDFRPLREPKLDELVFSGIGRPSDSFTTMMKRARVLTTNAENVEETSSERQYRKVFASYLGPVVDGHGEGGWSPVAVRP
jgi:thymidylate synthase